MTDREAEEILDKFDKEHPMLYGLASISFLLLIGATLIAVLILLAKIAKWIIERLLS